MERETRDIEMALIFQRLDTRKKAIGFVNVFPSLGGA
jgi:hypothetical protein